MTTNLLAEIEEEFEDTQEWKESIEDELKRKRAEDQSKLADRIILTFLLLVSILVLFVVYPYLSPLSCESVVSDDAVTTTCSSEAWKPKAEFVLTVISSVMLPVVTLVLGFYFGKEADKDTSS